VDFLFGRSVEDFDGNNFQIGSTTQQIGYIREIGFKKIAIKQRAFGTWDALILEKCCANLRLMIM